MSSNCRTASGHCLSISLRRGPAEWLGLAKGADEAAIGDAVHQAPCGQVGEDLEGGGPGALAAQGGEQGAQGGDVEMAPAKRFPAIFSRFGSFSWTFRLFL